jgi:trigger factor
MGTKVTIGVTNYIDDFLEQLIGHSPGDSFDVFVTFPQDYGVENLNGKEAVFAVTINHIVEEKVPELNDDFVKQNFSSMYGWETVAELETELMNDIRKESIDQFIETYIVENSTVSDLPEFIITYHENSMIHFYEHSAANYGMELEEFLPLIAGVASVDELRETYYDYHSEVARFFVIVQAIAEDANITVTETSLKNYFQENFGSEDYSDFEDYYGLPYLKMTVLHQLVFEYLNDNLIYE